MSDINGVVNKITLQNAFLLDKGVPILFYKNNVALK